jgi:alkanesulfonate monooxygenase SsuD/methylene tetrahydromethanopterin reductase-like flavin-dependent oxidoreductase (luciferase family)
LTARAGRCIEDGASEGDPSREDTMHVGIFIEESRDGVDEAEAFQEAFDLAESAEAWGLDGVWLGEVHFNTTRSVMSATVVVASAIAARTRRIRVGTAVQVLPLGNPVRMAEDAATVDQISQGRFDFGIGRSGSPRAYDAFGIPYGESPARLAEALEIILKAWTGERFTYHGTFYRVENAAISPRPVQRPHPPVRQAVSTDETFAHAGAQGMPIFVGLRAASGLEDLRNQLKLYRDAWQKAGRPGNGDVCLRIPVYASTNERAAVEEPRATLISFAKRQAEIARSAVGRAGAGPADRMGARAERFANLSYDDILKTRAACGTPARLIDQLGELRDELGLNGLIVEPNAGGLLSMDQEKRSLELFAKEVAPALKRG